MNTYVRIEKRTSWHGANRCHGAPEKGPSHPVLTWAQLETFQMKDHWVLPGGKTASSTEFITLACEVLWEWACAHTHMKTNKWKQPTLVRERLWKWILNTGISISLEMVTAHGGGKSLIKCGLSSLWQLLPGFGWATWVWAFPIKHFQTSDCTKHSPELGTSNAAFWKFMLNILNYLTLFINYSNIY